MPFHELFILPMVRAKEQTSSSNIRVVFGSEVLRDIQFATSANMLVGKGLKGEARTPIQDVGKSSFHYSRLNKILVLAVFIDTVNVGCR